MDDYYQLARKLEKLNRQALADELRKLHQSTVDAVTEYAADRAREGRELGESPEEIERAIRSIELRGRQLADDRAHLRHAEAVLYVVRQREPLIVNRDEVRAAFDAGHGVQTVREDAPKMPKMRIVQHPGKFAGA